MRNFQEFTHLGYPLMVAVSRKSYIGYAYKIDEPKQRDDASAGGSVACVRTGRFGYQNAQCCPHGCFG